ncbi:hypothetical protein [Microbacterium sp. CPCC 204701]|uniref:hypothetical protein n=1 Tax=Microbacterium sp. CPCC 204701 TaxID=2493084 RepID=UPI000FD6DAB3|nr:hypothetical protein [Microbacterium sp. CPCC 204701]
MLDAAPWELNSLELIPEGEHLESDPARILDVEVGPCVRFRRRAGNRHAADSHIARIGHHNLALA